MKINPAIRELICQYCEREYPVWYTENELWNKLIQESEEEIHFLCPACFTKLYEKRIKKQTHWKLLIPTRENSGV